MKTYYIIAVLAFMGACQEDDTKPVMKIEVNIGEPFIASAPSVITSKESDFILYIDKFSNYMDYGFDPGLRTAVIRYRDKKIELYHNVNCDQRDCEGVTYSAQAFKEEVKLDEFYTLRFNKVIASTIVREFEPEKGHELRVDAAEFILTSDN